MKALEDNGSIGNIGVHEFLEIVATFGGENESSFCGQKPLYLNSAGEPVVIFKPNILEKVGQVKDVEYFQREIINNIYQEDIAYDDGVLGRLDQWMNVARVFPLISLMYNVSLASLGGNASPGHRITLIFEYDAATGNVVLHEISVIRGWYPLMVPFVLLATTHCILNMLENTNKNWENAINIHLHFTLTKLKTYHFTAAT